MAGMITHITPVRRLATLLAVALPLAVVACTSRTNAEPEPARSSNALKVGQEVFPGGNALGVSLLSVEADSRCPKSVQCVWAGEAVVVIGYRLGMGPTMPVKLRWGAQPHDTVVAGTRIRFDSLTPYPTVAGPLLPQDQYRAWFTFSPAAELF
jgi:hypothetical protein